MPHATSKFCRLIVNLMVVVPAERGQIPKAIVAALCNRL